MKHVLERLKELRKQTCFLADPKAEIAVDELSDIVSSFIETTENEMERLRDRVSELYERAEDAKAN